MRATALALACAAGTTCDTAAPLRDEGTVAHVHTPVDPVVPAATASVTPPPPPPTQGGPFWEPTPDHHAVAILRDDAPNMRYAALDRATCEAELTRRNVPFIRGEPTLGVMAPVRLRGPLSGGVTIHSLLAPAQRDTSPMEIFDCRLAVALDDFSQQLAKRGVVEMVHLSAYRSRANGGCTPKYDGKQHCGGLAVDIASFKRKDGSTLSVERDFHGRVGLSTCTTHPAPTELWSIVCDAADRATFNVILSPNYNAQHFNHLHVEVTPDAAWMLVP
jgi:hypothetical protein